MHAVCASTPIITNLLLLFLIFWLRPQRDVVLDGDTTQRDKQFEPHHLPGKTRIHLWFEICDLSVTRESQSPRCV